MSLTDFVKQEDVRDRLNAEFPNKGTRASEPVKASWQTRNYMLVGTAFDYLLRWWMRREVNRFQARPWVAETSLELADEICPELKTDIEETIDNAKGHRDEYVDTGTVTRPLVESAIDLARIDGIYRGGVPPTDLGEYDDGDIVDCIRLLEILETTEFLNGQNAHLNPAFGLGSSLVGGADADVILDGMLVDVKVTGRATFKADYWRQLVGYLVLADIHNVFLESGTYDQLGISDEPDIQPLPQIETFGIYFARHGDFSTIPASIVYEADGYTEFRSWFVEAALDYNPRFGTEFGGIFRTIV
ncbi:hypothetical protein [Natronorubrum thiooxidans]|uniref:Uncharacterized protein n=1 Tax=Natronorubrum thiooxidans TaxID=308853 RepID=A0A1N7H8I4_9EURY|nr:hypothetical protein [Natronorubrum thiooxidans]SIS21184.1 hypothetical protein SAMN05421752_1332 [Natronorubrum thiooxidans]